MALMRSAAWRVSVGAVLLGATAMLSGCTAAGETHPSGETSPSPTASSGASEGVPRSDAPWDPGDLPDPSAAIHVTPAQRGDCPVNPADPGTITFVVTSDDDSTPVEVTYPVFRTDGTEQVRRMTQPGPVTVVLQADCTDGVPSGAWSFVATSRSGSLACALFSGGRLVASDSVFDESPGADGVRADCTGHPGM